VSTPVRLALVIFTALILQATLISELRVFHTTGDVMLLLGIAAGLVGGPQRGAVVGFAAGLSFHLLLHTPFGLSALAYCLTGYAVGSFQTTMLRSSRWIPVGFAAVSSAVGVFTFAIVGEVVGEQAFLSAELIRIIAVVAFVNALLSLLAMRVMRWALEERVASRLLLR